MSIKSNSKTTALSLVVETFFAILPLLVLGSLVQHRSEAGAESFWLSPEIPMTSCILYGLTLAKLIQGAIFVAARATISRRADMHDVAASYSALTLLPLLGVIASIILIARAAESHGGWKTIVISIINLCVGVAVFIVLGGHGIKAVEGEA